MEEQLSPLAVTHLLQHTLRSLCIHENSQWVYAVFWRILPRNYPPPKWEGHGAYDRSRGNRRNWILVWEDGFCNFGASSSSSGSSTGLEMKSSSGGGGSSVYGNSSCDQFQQYQGLQPELFFKMSHEIYNYGEGLIGKVAADHSHKWIYKEPNDQEINFLSAWHNSADSYPRTWEAQFQSGIKTIALIAVREGVVQLGAIHKVIEDLSYVVLLRKKFSYIESIPGVLLPHPSSSPVLPFKVVDNYGTTPDAWHYQGPLGLVPQTHHHNLDFYDQHQHQYNMNSQPLKNIITPSMSSLEALLSKLPSVVPPSPTAAAAAGQAGCLSQLQRPPPLPNLEFDMGMEKIAKGEIDEDEDNYRAERDVGESSSSMSAFRHHHHFHHHQDHHNVASGGPNSGF
ncbi:MYC/MYB transcription factor [Trema orientale]|uniref:MYC/MYB transcription factor n=1 Tax=Trema orientale TaxID=63057 RepID=A0A2P5FM97_TREOI|nr:MYC/MYB transcription factor [Trema orientale]